MSRHFEFLHDAAELIEDPEQLAETFPEWEPDTGVAALVIGNPWDAAGVVTGTRSEIAARLRAYLALLGPACGDDDRTGVLPRHEMDAP